MKKVTALMCTYGRFRYVRRAIGFFLNQDHSNKELLIYNNSPVRIEMDDCDHVRVVNNCIDLLTKKEYDNVGSIYRDALTFISNDTEYVSIWDDDDIYFENFLSTGIEYLFNNPELLVWRKRFYFWKSGESFIEILDRESYTEGACIIKRKFIDEIGFQIGTSLTFHHKWYHEAENRGLFGIDQSEFPCYCYETGQHDLAHISGLASYDDINTRGNVKLRANDFGNGEKLIPWSNALILSYFEDYFAPFKANDGDINKNI